MAARPRGRLAALAALAWLATAAAGCPRNIPRPRDTPPDDAASGRDEDATLVADTTRSPPGAPDVASPGDVPPGERRDGAGDAAIVEAGGGDRSTPGDDGGDAAPGVPCGTERPDISGVARVDALAIGPDGTIYFNQIDAADGWVGRIVPGRGRVEGRWARIAKGAQISGLAVNGVRRRLYVASVTGDAIHEVDVGSDVPTVRVFLSGVGSPTDLAIGPEGEVYFTERENNHVHRVTPAGVRSHVSSAMLTDSAWRSSPAALAFGRDGDLFVGMTVTGRIQRLKVVTGREQSRTPFGEPTPSSSALAVDVQGRVYVATFAADSPLLRFNADGTGRTAVTRVPWTSSVAFARGVLDCRDLYVASPEGPLRRVQVEAPGLPPP